MDDTKSSVFDFEQAVRNVDGDVDILYVLAEMYLEKHMEFIGQIASAIEVQNTDEVSHGAHQLKSATSNFFSHTVDEAIAKLSAAHDNGNWSLVKSSFDELEEAVKHLNSALAEFVARKTF